MESSPQVADQPEESSVQVAGQQLMESSSQAAEQPFPFLKLPPEMRNDIYKLALVCPKAPKFAIIDSWGVQDFQRGPGDTSRFGRIQDGKLAYRLGPDSDLTFFPGTLALFLTCKQVHHEAVTMFYEKNTFEMTSFHYGHDKVGDSFTTGAHWLEGLSSHPDSNGLKKVVINLETLCPSSCPFGHSWEDIFDGTELDPNTMLDVTAMMRAHWRRGSPLEISVVCDDTDRLYYPACSNPLGVPGVGHLLGELDLPNLNETMQKLFDDELDIKRHQYHIGRIAVSRAGDKGAILYNATTDHAAGGSFQWSIPQQFLPDPSCYYKVCIFDLKREGAKPELLFRVNEPNLLQLPIPVLHRILGHLLHPDGPMTVDVDKDKDLGTAIKLMLTRRNLSATSSGVVWIRGSLELRTSTNSSRFSDFESLRRWIHDGTLRQRNPPAFVTVGAGGVNSPTTRLLQLSNLRSLRLKILFPFNRLVFPKELKINLSSLIHATAHLHKKVDKGSDIKITFSVLCSRPGSPDTLGDYTVTLERLRKTAYRELPKIVARMGSMAETVRYPDIYVNGFGHFCDVDVYGPDLDLGMVRPLARDSAAHMLRYLRYLILTPNVGETYPSLASDQGKFDASLKPYTHWLLTIS